MNLLATSGALYGSRPIRYSSTMTDPSGRVMYSQEIGSIDPDTPPKRQRARIAAILGVLLLVVVCSVILPKTEQGFRPVEPGVYLGTVTLNLTPDNRATVHFVLDVYTSSPSRVFVRALDEGWEAEDLRLEVGEGQIVSWPAIVLRSADGDLRLTGGERKGALVSGEASDDARAIGAGWTLVALPTAGLPQGSEQELKLWLALSEEISTVEDRITVAGEQAPKQREEIEKLTAFISERGELKTRADQKLKVISDELISIRERLAERRKEARKLESKIDVALKVMPMGRLVSLSRESLEREGRWLQSMLGGAGAEGSAELNAAVERAEQIQQLQRQIRELKIELSRAPALENAEQSASENPEL